MTNTTPQVPAGWYPDPEAPGTLRWWDGYAWTEYRERQPVSLPASNAPGARPVAKNGMGTAALVLGLCAFGSEVVFGALGDAVGRPIVSIAICAFCMAALAVIFGILGTVRGTRLKQTIGTAVGRGMAITGIVLGGVFLLSSVSNLVQSL